MVNFKEYLGKTLVEGKEEAKYIREKLKKELGLSSRDVSVKSSYGGTSSSVRVTIKGIKGLMLKDKIEEIGKSQEDYDVDAYSGEILMGGNTFIFTNIDYKFEQELNDKIQKEFKKQLGDQEFNDDTPSIILFNTFSVNSSNGMKYVTVKGHREIAEIRDINYIGGAVEHLISKIKDYSLYKKIK